MILTPSAALPEITLPVPTPSPPIVLSWDWTIVTPALLGKGSAETDVPIWLPWTSLSSAASPALDESWTPEDELPDTRVALALERPADQVAVAAEDVDAGHVRESRATAGVGAEGVPLDRVHVSHDGDAGEVGRVQVVLHRVLVRLDQDAAAAAAEPDGARLVGVEVAALDHVAGPGVDMHTAEGVARDHVAVERGRSAHLGPLLPSMHAVPPLGTASIAVGIGTDVVAGDEGMVARRPDPVDLGIVDHQLRGPRRRRR